MNNIKFMVIMFTALIIGAVFLGVLADYKYDSETPTTVTNESIAIAGGYGELDNEGFLSGIAFHNFTGAETHTRGLTNGSINITYLGAVYTAKQIANGTYNVSYTYGDVSKYVHNARARVIIPIILIFFALGVLIYAIYWAKENLKDYL